MNCIRTRYINRFRLNRIMGNEQTLLDEVITKFDAKKSIGQGTHALYIFNAFLDVTSKCYQTTLPSSDTQKLVM